MLNMSPSNFSDDEIFMIENLNLNLLTTPNQPETPTVYHCGICSKKVGVRHKSVQCDLCDKWNHIKCDEIDNKTYEALKKSSELEKYYCKLCKENIFAFKKLTDDEFLISVVKNININEDLNLQISPPPAIEMLLNDFSTHSNDESSPINCDYYHTTTHLPSSNNAKHSMFHLNLASLGLHKDELVAVLSLLDFEFDIIAISETRIKAGTSPNYDMSLPGYKHYDTQLRVIRVGLLFM